MKQFAATASIHATPERVWSILSDAQRYPEWNPTVSKVEGRIAAGERIAVHATISPGRAFPVTVAAFDPPRRMVWRGGMPLGLFVGERVFEIVPRTEGVVESACANDSPACSRRSWAARSRICSRFSRSSPQR
jgi:uncharacterized protein YndB with AHSA1/START domain